MSCRLKPRRINDRKRSAAGLFLKMKFLLRTKHIFSSSNAHRTLASVFAALALALIGGLAVLAQHASQPKLINLYPTTYSADGWSNATAAFMQDVSEDGIYQDFNIANSSYSLNGDITPSSIPAVLNNPAPSPVQSPSPSIDQTLPSSASSEATSFAPAVSQQVSATEKPQPAASPPASYEPSSAPAVTSYNEPAASIEYSPSPAPVSDSPSPTTETSPSPEIPAFTPAASDALPETVFPPADAGQPAVSRRANLNSLQKFIAGLSSQICGLREVEAQSIGQGMLPEAPLSDDIPAASAQKALFASSSIVFSDFGVSGEQEKIYNAQLRFSLAARPILQEVTSVASIVPSSLLVQFYYGRKWETAGEIVIDKEISNALNGGYFLYALPIFNSWEDLSKLKIRFVHRGPAPSVAYLDSVWIEIDTNKTVVEEPSTELEIDEDKLRSEGKILGLMSRKDVFNPEENPELKLKYVSNRNVLGKILDTITFQNGYKVKDVSFRDAVGNIVHLPYEISYGENNEWSFRVTAPSRSFKPGKYVMEAQIDEGWGSYSGEQAFYWGVLAVNTDKSVYKSGESAYIQMASLTDGGNTMCDANLRLTITGPDGNPKPFFTQAGTISESGKCGPNKVIVDEPDYFLNFPVTATGTYAMVLSRLDEEGRTIHEIADSFEVRSYAPFDISRKGPTRIYPLASYSMSLDISAK